MYCPKCGQQQVSEETRYCSRCGFLLTGVSELVANQGMIPHSRTTAPASDSPRRRGVKKGIFILLLTLFVVPLLSVLALATNSEPIAALISAVILVCGGILRTAYALLFQPAEPLANENLGRGPRDAFQVRGSGHQAALPGASSIPAQAYVSPETGAWRETNELPQPSSVIDSTTKLLAKDQSN